MMFEDYFVYEVTIGFLVVICLMLAYMNHKYRKQIAILLNWSETTNESKIRERAQIIQSRLKVEYLDQIKKLKVKLARERMARRKALQIIRGTNG